MTSDASLDYQRLLREAEVRTRVAEERTRVAEQRTRQLEEKLRQAKERERPTNFDESVLHNRDLTCSPETENPSPTPSSAPLPSSSPSGSSAANKDVSTGSRAAGQEDQGCDAWPDSSDAGQSKLAGKRGFSNASGSSQPTRPRDRPPAPEGHQPPRHDARFCSQLCILGLRNNLPLDSYCPNIELHRRHPKQSHHSISADELLQKLKEQLDDDLDANCTPFADCGSHAVPFKLTLAAYGYTLVGKGTTSSLWGEVSEEIQTYRILQKSQGGAVPVFLGPIDLGGIYFVTGAGEIRHMLIMSYGGVAFPQGQYNDLKHEFRRSRKEIKDCGVIHNDLSFSHMLWDKHTGRVVIIDFHGAKLDGLRIQAPGVFKRRTSSYQPLLRRAKRIRA
ncbi:hypothetical protein QQS21_005813 [Conoideocrella luteorostrata]|uniref:Uncharacterized protein n=1 Tax=Conoideocrella luteorostrata TaxID=1105319 RepID=A0AAJ0CRP6_9HYPO|nr:hypothetical protein QQS21_005813 [Conoideocrella luteorostrata]